MGLGWDWIGIGRWDLGMGRPGSPRVLFQAPWCPYSRRLEPTWAELFEEGVAEHLRHVVGIFRCASSYPHPTHTQPGSTYRRLHSPPLWSASSGQLYSLCLLYSLYSFYVFYLLYLLHPLYVLYLLYLLHPLYLLYLLYLLYSLYALYALYW